MREKLLMQEESKDLGVPGANKRSCVYNCIEESKEPRRPKKRSLLQRSESVDIAIGTENKISPPKKRSASCLITNH